jgi:MoaA/NifB/PqqE/SkfB family radical SAM enzyme
LHKPGSFIRQNDIYSINIYGGEPFLDIKLFNMVFNEVYEDYRAFFVSTNGSFLVWEKKREYFYDLLKQLRYNQGEVTGIRISNTIYHEQCRNEKQKAWLNRIKRYLSDPYEWYEDQEDPDYSMQYERNPFYAQDDRPLVYIDKMDGGEMNPSGRALKNYLYGDRRCYCPITHDYRRDTEAETHLNVRPDGDIQICCTCDGCVVGNILEPGLTKEVLEDRIMRMSAYLKTQRHAHADTKMIDLCPDCKKYRVDDEKISKWRR